MIDDRTTHLNLPLPNQDNTLIEDVPRLRDAFTALDTAVNDRLTSPQVQTLIDTAVAALVNGAPNALDTLKELADALGDDANFATTITNALAGKAPTVHTHTIANVTGLQAALDGKLSSVPIGSASAVGGFKVGANLTVDPDGTLNAAAGGGGATATFYDYAVNPISNGQTSFTVSGGYTVGKLDVFLNGALLLPSDDYTATNGTTVVLATGANTVDTLVFRKWVITAVTDNVAKAGDSMTGALNFAASATVASAATTDIGGASSNNVVVTGNATITALGTAPAGATRKVVFTGAPVLTHNATSLILLSGANISVIAGSAAEFLSLGSGNWRCLSYDPSGSSEAPTNLIYDNRANLRSMAYTDGSLALVEGLGLFKHMVGADEGPDDDETAFQTSTGYWVLICPTWDVVDAYTLVDEDYQNNRLISAETRLTAAEAFTAKMFRATSTQSAFSLAINSSTTFTVTVTGAVAGAAVVVTPPSTPTLNTITVFAWVSAANTVTVYIGNANSALTGGFGAGDWQLLVINK